MHAGYAERRRLERDLHDGAQQRLVSLGMALRLAQRHLHDATLDVNGLLDQSVTELGTAIDELRQIAHGLRPSSLDDGLGPALMALTGGVFVPVTVDVQADLLPDQIATAAPGVCRYRLHHLAPQLFPQAGLYQQDYAAGSQSYLHADPVEDAEAAAHLILAAQQATGAHTLAELLAATGTALRLMEQDRCQRSERAWVLRHSIRLRSPE
ncbi:sensor histidine kinase [Sphaerisporangium corydalis]|uniref:histidine kinase n=1 Tax=Sphaerisporangium corydalis TaxID=1441875 RepID=A0ABV9EL14_9ACTN|nr:histidine kinase [Sphaerisporangium corydalis]